MIISDFFLTSIGVVVCFLLCKGMSTPKIHIPPEWEPHSRTCMVWPATPDIWGTPLFDKVREDIARIAKAISPYEPVTLIVNPDQVSSAESAFTSSDLQKITIVPMPVDDLWARDTLPVFGVQTDQPPPQEDGSPSPISKTLVGVDLNFNGWGNKKQVHAKDSNLAQTFLAHFNISRISSRIVGEGGSLEFDGDGTLLVTESSLFNTNRNPSFGTRQELEQELMTVFGLEKIIWFKGVVGQDITDAHVDSLARFVRPGVVILNRPPKGSTEEDVWSKSSDEARSVLQATTDAKGRSFTIVELYEPDRDKIVGMPPGTENEFLASYVNYLVVNGAVIMPQFGDTEADAEAKAVLALQYPGRTVVQVNISNLASGGGGIHCATHDIPSLTSGDA
ncbi:putative agmatine deiminase isoform X2 [Folsomia candida]|uniref:Putative agmatine deiminase n=2 Tax=Folsomia candida TaxID=158441 RepID=A0A226E356_FOLCA|nr:putative agmatine deiminase isoform X2 [Folsomia candida]XP_021955740.1 putative agmatine deiminase isoform X2 [Folsomia candida]OXA51708.1 putative agmatine deiminase [Folsomia candida]